MTTQLPEKRRFVLVSVLSGLVCFAILQAAALTMTGGVFEYPLDDAYIHLSMAEGIWSGGYGVNPGEYASAASSPLYPVLLTPIGSPEFHRFTPLIWNIFGLILSAWLWAELLVVSGWGQARLRPIGFVLAGVGPLAVLMVSVAYVGMEHTLHGAASLAILLGLYCHLQGKPRPYLLLVGILFAPLLRFEGVAMALMASGILLFTGERRLGMIGVALSLLPIMGFMVFLVSIGLEPLPNSVQTKLGELGPDAPGVFIYTLAKFRTNITDPGGALLALLCVANWVMMAISGGLRTGGMRLLAMFLLAAGFLHLLFGQFGWFDRYEHYVLASLIAGFIALVPTTMSNKNAVGLAAIASAPLIGMLAIYLPGIIMNYPASPRAIHIQQQQMAQFAKEFMDTPVAVNDLGWVSWNNDNYVLDLWGLASAQAREIRLNGAEPGWAGQLTRQQDVPFAMVYDRWLKDGIGADWTKIGDLELREYRGFLGDGRVAFYATAPEYVEQVQSALAAWVPDLHPLTFFTYAEGME